MVTYAKRYNSAYPSDVHNELIYTEEEIASVINAIEMELDAKCPVEFSYFLKSAGAGFRSQLFYRMDRPNRSTVMASLEEAHSTLRNAYDLFGGIEPIPNEIMASMGEPKSQLYDSVIEEIHAALCDDEISPSVAKAPVHQYLDNLQESCYVLSLAIKIAQKRLQSGDKLGTHYKNLSDIRREFVQAFSYGFHEYFGIKPTKYAEGKFAKCLKIVFDSLKCSFRGQIITMPYPDDIYPLLVEGLTKSEEVPVDLYWSNWSLEN